MAQQEGEKELVLSQAELVSDIAARVRGYARHLAVVAINPNVLYGIYKLPVTPNSPKNKYVHVAIDRDDGEHGGLFALELTHAADHPTFSENPRGLMVVVAGEQHQPTYLALSSEPDGNPIGAPSLHTMQRLMGWLRYFDTVIPALEPSEHTARMIEFFEDQQDRFGTANEDKMLF